MLSLLSGRAQLTALLVDSPDPDHKAIYMGGTIPQESEFAAIVVDIIPGSGAVAQGQRQTTGFLAAIRAADRSAKPRHDIAAEIHVAMGGDNGLTILHAGYTWQISWERDLQPPAEVDTGLVFRQVGASYRVECSIPIGA